MLDIQRQLFIGDHIALGPIDHEKDPAIESRWTHNSQFIRMFGMDPTMPRSAAEIKKSYEEIEKSQEEKHDLFYFAIRLREDDRLIGFGKIYWIMWVNSYGWIQLGIGDPNDRQRGFGSEALGLLLRFAFSELNLYRLSALIPAYNQAAIGLFHKLGFVDEVRRRLALERDGQRWDMLELGLLANEWAQWQYPGSELIHEAQP
jgi:RimJ/RimL family protein N-acetyltransferase